MELFRSKSLRTSEPRRIESKTRSSENGSPSGSFEGRDPAALYSQKPSKTGTAKLGKTLSFQEAPDLTGTKKFLKTSSFHENQESSFLLGRTRKNSEGQTSAVDSPRTRKGGEGAEPSSSQLPKISGEATKGILKRPDDVFQRPRRLSTVVNCPICFEQYVDPKMLPCQHTFCLTCLQKYAQVDIDSVICPTCRGKFLLPEEGFSKLPNNLSVQYMLDVLEVESPKTRVPKPEKSVSFPVKCERCKQDRKASPCSHCNQTLCLECETFHFTELRSTTADLLESLKAARESVTSICDAIKNRAEKVEANINDVFETKMENLKIQRQSMLADLLQLSDQQATKSKETVAGIDDVMLSLEKARRDVVKEGEFATLVTQVDALLGEVRCFNNIRIIFDESQFKLTVGETPIKKPIAEPELEEVPKKIQTPTNADEQSLFYRKKPTTAKVRFSHSLLQRPAGIAISPWTGEIYVAGTDSHRVLIFDRQGNYQSSLGGLTDSDKEVRFLCPFGIAFSVANEEIYVTDKWRNCVQVFDKQGNHRRQIGGKGGKGTANFRSPVGVAVDGNGLIYICDTCNDRILVLDKAGTPIRTIGESIPDGQKTTKSEFNEPTGVSVSADGSRIAVCDYGNHRIKIFNKIGTRVECFGFRGIGRGQFEYPECLAVDSRGFILVGDNGNTRVQVFRPNGDFVCAFGSKKSDDFSWISGLALTEENEVIVSDFKTHMISII